MRSRRLQFFSNAISKCVVRLRPFLLLIALASVASSQSVTDGTTPGALTPGAPVGSYALSGLDNINLFNGNLNFSLPLAGSGGRGGVRIPVSLLVESHWRVDRWVGGDPPFEIDTGVYTGWMERPYLDPGRLEIRTQGDNNGFCEPSGWSGAYITTLSRITWTAFDGTEYELIDQTTGGQWAANGDCMAVGNNYRFRGTVFKSTDGSEITFISDSQIVDSPWPGNSLLQPGATFSLAMVRATALITGW